MRARRHSAAALLGLLFAVPLVAQQPGPPATGGVARLDVLLQHLAETRRILVIGAHPDDEDTELITWASRHVGAEAAYLSITRGEGGQNLIGDELGVALGLLRTRELEAARAIDGGRQFFTRAYDFGFTRSLEETERFWPPDSILKDVVRVIRRFRPHVIVTVFSGTPRDGHGQHQYSAVIGQRGYAAAGDPAAFPELLAEEGLAPWRPLKLYRSARFAPASATLTIEGGVIDHRVGKTIHQIAMESRSQHRSQDFGVLQEIGPSAIRLTLVDDRTGAGDGGLFAGIPLAATPLTRFADSLRRQVAPATLPAVARALEGARARLAPVPPGYDDALAVARGHLTDLRAPAATLVAGTPVELAAESWAPGDSAVTRDVLALTPARPDQPYFLAAPLAGALYDWSGVDPVVLGLPFAPEAPATFRTRDQALGEVRAPVRVVPPLGVALAPALVVWPAADTTPRAFAVTLTNYTAQTIQGMLRLESADWALPDPVSFTVEPGQVETVVIAVRRPPGTRSVRAVAQVFDAAYDRGVVVIDYPHIVPVQYLPGARASVTVAPIALPSVTRVGYVRGAADGTPEVLRQVGLPLTVLDSAALARADLSAYDAIVIGPRAYETDSAVVRYDHRLRDYVRGGGHLVVQYQQYDFVQGDYAPYPLTISRPHDRITDEAAPVTLLEPGHAAFTRPNRIGADDWHDWPQERGLYFAGAWDDAYTPLLEMQDPGRDPVRGGLLVARVGQGTYVYTGISFFRAVPAGNPGALRLLLNLIDLEAADIAQ